jgi:hypothetical protein
LNITPVKFISDLFDYQADVILITIFYIFVFLFEIKKMGGSIGIPFQTFYRPTRQRAGTSPAPTIAVNKNF